MRVGDTDEDEYGATDEQLELESAAEIETASRTLQMLGALRRQAITEVVAPCARTLLDRLATS